MNVQKIAAGLGKTPTERLLTMMARLRDPDNGCPWDVEQTFATIAPYTIEEAYEVADAIERGDMADLKEELGDLLLQVVFHARMAEEDSLFDFDTVADALVEKMIARHPHVFGDVRHADSAEQYQTWESLKDRERQHKGRNASVLDGVALALPALMRAVKLQNRAARVGFDWDGPEQVLDKIIEESREIIDARQKGEDESRIAEEVGDLLFAVTNLARKLNVDPELALRQANQKFVRRFEHMEQAADAPLKQYSLDELEALWVAAKQALKS